MIILHSKNYTVLVMWTTYRSSDPKPTKTQTFQKHRLKLEIRPAEGMCVHQSVSECRLLLLLRRPRGYSHQAAPEDLHHEACELQHGLQICSTAADSFLALLWSTPSVHVLAQVRKLPGKSTNTGRRIVRFNNINSQKISGTTRREK